MDIVKLHRCDRQFSGRVAAVDDRRWDAPTGWGDWTVRDLVNHVVVGNTEVGAGRLVGGCAATNGTSAARGCPADHDAWAAAGNPGWSFDDLLPVFHATETDLDFGTTAWHGSDGRLPIRRYSAQEMNAPASAFLGAAAADGHPEVLGGAGCPVWDPARASSG